MSSVRFQSKQACERAGLRSLGPDMGCVIIGPPGSGKTTVLGVLRETAPGPVVEISGVRRTAEMVFGHLKAVQDLLASGKEATPLRVRWAVADVVNGQTVLIVDDAHLLDEDAAAVVHSLVVHDGVSAYVACTATALTPTPDALRALWKDDHLTRVDLPMLGEREVRDYLVNELDRPVTSRDAKAFHRWSRGNPGLLVDLVTSSLNTESWNVVNGVAVLSGRPVPTPQALEDLDSTAGRLNGDVLAVVQAFAVAVPVIGGPLADWLPLTPLVDMVGMEKLVAAERADVIEADAERVRLVVPYLADVVAVQTPALRRTQLIGRLAAAFTSGGVPGDDMTALTGLLVMSTFDNLTAADRWTAARSTLRLGDPAATRAFAALGLESDPDYSDLAAVHAWALIHLNDMASLTDAIRARGDDQRPGWRGIIEFLAEFATRGDIGAREFVVRHDAESGGLLGTLAAWTERDRLSGSWLGFALAETTLLVGRFGDSRALLRASAVGADDDGLLAFHLALVEERLIAVVDGAERACTAVERARQAVRWRSDQVQASADFVCAVAHIRAGRYDVALRELRDCAPFLAGTRLEDWPAGLIERIRVITGGAALGPVDAQIVDLPVDPYRAWRAGEDSIDTAWQLVRLGDVDEAVNRLVAVAEQMVETVPTLAVDQLECAARFISFGDPRLVSIDRCVRQVAERVGAAGRVDALVAFVSALVEGDGLLLEAVAGRYRDLGLVPVEADVIAQAARAHQVAGQTVAALACSAAANRLVGALGGPVSPAQGRRTDPGLTRREREVVELVAQDLSNAEVADRLRVSVRTVEGHLLRAAGKLAAGDRHEVAQRWRELA